MITLTKEQIEKLTFSYEQGLKAYGLRRPVAKLYLDSTEQDRSDREVLRCMLREVIGYMTGKLDLCEVSHILSEVAEEFEEEVAT